MKSEVSEQLWGCWLPARVLPRAALFSKEDQDDALKGKSPQRKEFQKRGKTTSAVWGELICIEKIRGWL